MSYPSASPPTHHGRHAAAAAVVALLALYFVAPMIPIDAVWHLKSKGHVTRATAVWVDDSLFAPIQWLRERSQSYDRFLEAESNLCVRLLTEPY